MKPTLTKAEERVIEMIADGHDADDIASTLCISTHTVRLHIRIAADKIGGRGKPIVRLLRWYFNEKRAA